MSFINFISFISLMSFMSFTLEFLTKINNWGGVVRRIFGNFATLMDKRVIFNLNPFIL